MFLFCCFSFFLFHVQLRRHPPVKWLIFLLLFFFSFTPHFFLCFNLRSDLFRSLHLLYAKCISFGKQSTFLVFFFPFLSLCFLASVVNCYLVRRNYSFYAVFHCFVCFLLRFSFFLLSRDCRLFCVLFLRNRFQIIGRTWWQ